ncbi:MAG: WXG100 family type VII secretion target [Hamadaea sp.]|nr:WXG100 family type VII secretion target [Hamadaea sp.]
MAYEDLIRYEFETIDSGVAAMRQASEDVLDELNRLRTSLADVLAKWEGEGDATFVQVKQDWDQAQTLLQYAHGEIASSVSRVNTNMQDTEQQVVSILRSHTL